MDINKPDEELHQLDLVQFEMQLPDLTTYKDLHAGMNGWPASSHHIQSRLITNASSCIGKGEFYLTLIRCPLTLLSVAVCSFGDFL